MVCQNQTSSLSIRRLGFYVDEGAPQHDLNADASIPNYASLHAPIRQLVSRFIHTDFGKLNPQANSPTLAAKEENYVCLAMCECVLEARQGLIDRPNT
jgi:hypothetical protein